MANSMRMVWDNAADRSTLAASSAVLPVTNLQTESKTDVWRSSSFPNVMIAPDDLTNAAWVKRGTCTVTANQAVGPNGTQVMDLVTGIGTGGVNDFYQLNTLSLSALVRIEPAFYIKRVSTTGLLSVTSASVVGGGSWSINLAMLSDNVEFITRTHPAVIILQEWITGTSGETGIEIFCATGTVSAYFSGITITQQIHSVSAAFASLENVSCVSLPYCNVSPTALARVRKTTETSITNQLTYSEGTISQHSAYGGFAADATTSITNFPHSIQFALSGTDAYAYRSFSTNIGTTYTFSIFIQMDDNGVPVPSTSAASGDFTITLQSDLWLSAATVTSVGNNVYRISKTFTATTTGANYGLAKYHTQSARNFRCSGAQLEVSSTLSSYYPTGSSAALRPLGYIDQWQSYTQDSGYVLAHGSTAVKIAGLTATQASSAYQYGGGASATSYTASIPCYGVRVDIIDTANLQGYIEASRLVIGDYFSPVYDAEIGAKISYEDTGKNFRNDAGNLMSDIGNRYKSIDFNLGAMQEVDRAALWKIVSYCGTSYPVFMSLYPGNTNKDLEQAHTVYGKFSSATKMASKAYGVYEAPLTIEGI